MSDNSQIRLDGETSVVSLENVMQGLKDTIALSRTTSNFSGADYLEAVSNLGISNAPTDKIGLILNQYMQLFTPGRVSVLPQNAPLAPNTGEGAEFYSGINRDW
jgi:phospholipid N-methyltransferase